MTPKPIGIALPVFLVLALAAWLWMLRSFTSWVGKGYAGTGDSDKIAAQAWSAGGVLVVWIALAALLLIAGSRGALPGPTGVAIWVTHLVSLGASLLAVFLLNRPELRWPLAGPVGAPLLIAGYIVWVCIAPRATPGAADWSICAAILILSLPAVPPALQMIGEGDGSIDATPGPKLDAWMAKQREARRVRELDELSKIDEDTTLSELQSHVQPDSPVLKEALEAMRKLPNRQAEAVQLLRSKSSFILHFLGDIDVEPTPELCEAARFYLREQAKPYRKDPLEYVLYSALTEGVASIRWISEHCDCDAELAEVEKTARASGSNPEAGKFIEAVVDMREKLAQRKKQQ
jgi:hypothetical protein